MDLSGKTALDVALSFGRSRLAIRWATVFPRLLASAKPSPPLPRSHTPTPPHPRSELLFEYQNQWARRLKFQCILLFGAGSSAMRELMEPDTLRLITEFVSAPDPNQAASLDRIRQH